MNETVRYILENNPGLISIILTGVILPLGILIITNRNNRKLKEIEKNIDLQYKAKDDIRAQEKKVYSSLSKILFEVQQLHVALSGKCIDTNCIANALAKFDLSINKCHDEIADNMLYLSSDAINLIYKFYNLIGELKIQLLELDNQKKHDIANLTVYYSSQHLADTLMDIQELFLSQRGELKVNFDKSKQRTMRNCCGQEPPKELREKYERARNSMIEDNIIISS